MLNSFFGLNVLSHKSNKMEAKKQRVSDLPSAHIGTDKIRNIMNCSKKLIDGGEGLARKPGNDGLNNFSVQ